MSSWREKPTSDLIVLFLTLVVAVVLITSLVGGFVWKITDPDADLTDIAARVGDITNTLIGAIVGFLAGKGAGAAGVFEQQQTTTPTEQDGEV